MGVLSVREMSQECHDRTRAAGVVSEVMLPRVPPPLMYQNSTHLRSPLPLPFPCTHVLDAVSARYRKRVIAAVENGSGLRITTFQGWQQHFSGAQP